MLVFGLYFPTFQKFIVSFSSCSSSPRRISGTAILCNARSTYSATQCDVLEKLESNGYRLFRLPSVSTNSYVGLSRYFADVPPLNVQRFPYSRVHISCPFSVSTVFQIICPAPGSIMYRSARSVLTTKRFFSSPNPKY